MRGKSATFTVLQVISGGQFFDSSCTFKKIKSISVRKLQAWSNLSALAQHTLERKHPSISQSRNFKLSFARQASKNLSASNQPVLMSHSKVSATACRQWSVQFFFASNKNKIVCFKKEKTAEAFSKTGSFSDHWACTIIVHRLIAISRRFRHSAAQEKYP